MYEVAVIGAGPAGLAATLFCLQKGMDVVVISTYLGGKTVHSLNLPDIGEYHLGKEIEHVQVMRAHIEYHPHVWIGAEVARIEELPHGFELHLGKVSAASGSRSTISAERLIVATGASHTTLEVPGEHQFAGRSLGYDAASYSHMLQDRRVVIIGNGRRAIESSLECSVHCDHVTLILESDGAYSTELLALVENALDITVYLDYRVEAFYGRQYAESVAIHEDIDGQRTMSTHVIEANAFFIEREVHPSGAVVSHLVDLTPTGAIRIDARNTTSHPRIFAAGDATDAGINNILVALGEGTRAALSAYRHYTLSR